MITFCAICGVEFKPKKKTWITCSKLCSSERKREKRRGGGHFRNKEYRKRKNLKKRKRQKLVLDKLKAIVSAVQELGLLTEG